MYNVYFSRAFDRDLRRLTKKNPELKSQVRSQINKLARNPQNPSLRLHKLSGQNSWSISVTRDLRIIFGFVGREVYLARIGKHDDVY